MFIILKITVLQMVQTSHSLLFKYSTLLFNNLKKVIMHYMELEIYKFRFLILIFHKHFQNYTKLLFQVINDFENGLVRKHLKNKFKEL